MTPFRMFLNQSDDGSITVATRAPMPHETLVKWHYKKRNSLTLLKKTTSFDGPKASNRAYGTPSRTLSNENVPPHQRRYKKPKRSRRRQLDLPHRLVRVQCEPSAAGCPSSTPWPILLLTLNPKTVVAQTIAVIARKKLSCPSLSCPLRLATSAARSKPPY
jgi:hypothetical protein